MSSSSAPPIVKIPTARSVLNLPPLFQRPIPIIGITGPVGSGKTIFSISIDPARTLYLDGEMSGASYAEDYGIERVDIHERLQSKFSKLSRNYTPLDVYEWWVDFMTKLEPARYSVIVHDTWKMIEAGLVNWVEDHSDHFGHTPAQYRAMNGAMKWGDVSKHLEMLCLQFAAKAECLVFVNHVTDVRDSDGKVTGKLKPQGNKILMQVASMYLHMERKPDKKGDVPEVPAAIVLKSRLVSPPKFDPTTGDIIEGSKRILPERIPVCTPAEIRKYFDKPVGDKLKASERLPVEDDSLTEDQKLLLETRRAEAAAEAMKAEVELQTKREKLEENRRAMAQVRADNAAAATGSNGDGITDDQIQAIIDLKKLMVAAYGLEQDEAAKDRKWEELLEPFGVKSARNMTFEIAKAFIEKLEETYGFNGAMPANHYTKFSDIVTSSSRNIGFSVESPKDQKLQDQAQIQSPKQPSASPELKH